MYLISTRGGLLSLVRGCIVFFCRWASSSLEALTFAAYPGRLHQGEGSRQVVDAQGGRGEGWDGKLQELEENTLGEYREGKCQWLGLEECTAVDWIDDKVGLK